MQIKHIKLNKFRNYPELDLEINSKMVILSGPNAVGKTNLLESVYFGSLFKSFRDDADYIFLKNTTNAYISLDVEKNFEKHNLEIFLEKRDKIFANFKLDGVKKRRKELLGFYKVVIFEPGDVDIFEKSPEERRKYLNMVLAQKNILYLDDLNQYKKILTQRNRLLFDIKNNLASQQSLADWDEQLIIVGARIILERKRYSGFINQRISEIYTAITKFHRSIEMVYETIPGDSLEEITQNLKEKLEENRRKELVLATTVTGPHRDDFHLQSEGVYLAPFSSRGEQRSQILALKILELEYLTVQNDYPILLLDDVLSELDEQRRTFLLKYLQDKYQTFITTTHPLELTGQHITLTPQLDETEEVSNVVDSPSNTHSENNNSLI